MSQKYKNALVRWPVCRLTLRAAIRDMLAFGASLVFWRPGRWVGVTLGTVVPVGHGFRRHFFDGCWGVTRVGRFGALRNNLDEFGR